MFIRSLVRFASVVTTLTARLNISGVALAATIGLLTLLACPLAVAGQPVAGDVDGNGDVDATDIQLQINAVLAIDSGSGRDIDY